MLKRTRAFLRGASGFVVSGAVLLCFVWIVYASESFQTCIEADTSDEAEQSSDYNITALSVQINRHGRCLGEYVHGNGEAIIALFTVILAISTILLWLSTRRLAVHGERALVDLERPQVFVDVVQSGIGITVTGAISKAQQHPFKFRVNNYGRTVAHLTEIGSSFPITAIPSDPAISDTSKDGRRLPYGTVAALNSPYFETRNLYEVCDFQKLWPDDAWRTQRLWFIGWVRYTDIFKISYIVGFCYAFDPLSNSFVLRGGDKYNYTRKELNAGLSDPS